MKIYLDCYPCFLRQALQAARLSGADEEQQRLIVERVLDDLRKSGPGSTPPEMGDRIHRIVRELGGRADPYQSAKEESTRQALALYPWLKELVARADDPLITAARISIAGNIIDFGPSHNFNLKDTVERVLAQPFAIDDTVAFRECLATARGVLYLADNAGETVFDRVLIDHLATKVIYVVKSGPILNDAIMEDALAAGLDSVATLIENGYDAPGTILNRCSAEFRRLYNEAELIIAKGQANYETLSQEGERVFFLLQTKCPVISRDAGVPDMSIILKRGGKDRGHH
ncbi:MAG: DUF89 family protein [Candidatus Eisenbacteria sp.]|nr:DUF89 family protein [Candidatus Eisenbacteria bacterium]